MQHLPQFVQGDPGGSFGFSLIRRRYATRSLDFKITGILTYRMGRSVVRRYPRGLGPVASASVVNQTTGFQCGSCSELGRSSVIAGMIGGCQFWQSSLAAIAD